MHTFCRFPVIRLVLGACALTAVACSSVSAQTAPPATDSNTPLHLVKPAYPVPYGPTTVEQVSEVLRRIHSYLLKTHRLEINDSAVQLYR